MATDVDNCVLRNVAAQSSCFFQTDHTLGQTRRTKMRMLVLYSKQTNT